MLTTPTNRTPKLVLMLPNRNHRSWRVVFWYLTSLCVLSGLLLSLYFSAMESSGEVLAQRDHSPRRADSMPTTTEFAATEFAATGFTTSNSTPQPPLTKIQSRGRSSVSFDLTGLMIPAAEIQSGGPPKDGIPALSNPKTVAAADAKFLRETDRVIGVTIKNASRAYPIAILTQHEIINDRLGEAPIAVTYCPLCDSAVVFDRNTPIGEREFGVSGLLYNSNVLMYDRSKRESLWSQVMAQGVSGPAAGKKLATIPMELVRWGDWKERHPNTDIVSTNTGHRRSYQRNPYASYFRQKQLMFPVRPLGNAMRLKEPVLGVWDGQSAIAFPLARFKGKPSEFQTTLNGKSLTISADPAKKTIRVLKADEGLSWMNSFWFAWYAFRPQTDIFTPNSRR